MLPQHHRTAAPLSVASEAQQRPGILSRTSAGKSALVLFAAALSCAVVLDGLSGRQTTVSNIALDIHSSLTNLPRMLLRQSNADLVPMIRAFMQQGHAAAAQAMPLTSHKQ